VLEQDSTKRFSSRVRDYQRFRPGYPAAAIELLRHECGLAQNTVVADIASGTGIFSRLLLEAGARVIGVEPNAEMRSAGDDFLAPYTRFESVEGTAEATGLPQQKVDLITAAQAAHWFDLERARPEFLRILKPGGWLVLIWNDRRQSTAFAREYEGLLVEFGTDYLEVRRLDENRNVEPLFGSSSFMKKVFPNSQKFDYAGLEGRLLSSSYAPRIGSPHHPPMLRKLRSLFETYQESGRVIFEYDTQVFYGQLT
jgi:SAM-dependent methyltransferase